jgi:riboflavin kinase/FMN adenylyltransferase
LILIPFDLEFSKTTAEAFVNDILWGKLRIRKILIGHDYAFGKNKVGNNEFLADFGNKLGFEVETIHAIKLGDETISSTRLRYSILNGNLKLAASLLGRSYNISGIVIPGKSRGTVLGIPTANIKPDKELLPAHGVYAVIVELEGNRHPGVLNIGFNPTFSNEELSIEVYLLDFTGNIYGEKLNVLFIDRLRDEVKFEKPGQLVKQIKRDIEQARQILKPYFMPTP